MANWTGGLLTAAGRALQAKVEAGTKLELTKIKLGDGTETNSNVDDLTDLTGAKATLGISSVKAENSLCTVTGVILTSNVTAGFYAREWGLFAKDPDAGEILYMISLDPNPDYVPPSTAALKVSATYAMSIAVSNAANIAVKIDPDGLTTVDMLNAGACLVERSKAYAVGERLYTPTLTKGLQLQCTTAGTTADTMLDCSANKLGDTITDGTVVWTVEQTQLITTASKALADLTPAVDKVPYFNSQNTAALTDITDAGRAVLAKSSADELLQYVVPNNAGAHNGIFRGKDLTSYFTSGGMSTAIADGTFKDIYIDDYIDMPMTVNGTSIGTVRWCVGECDYFLYSYGTGGTHHVLMVPSTVMGAETRMNPTGTTQGGYVGSEMYTATLPLYAEAITNAFGEKHVMTHKEILTTGVDANAASAAGGGMMGAANASDWKDVTASLLTEAMVFGGNFNSSSPMDNSCGNKQLALFALSRQASIYATGYWYWLRSVADATSFCCADPHAISNSRNAAMTDYMCVRPYFLLY